MACNNGAALNLWKLPNIKLLIFSVCVRERESEGEIWMKLL